MIVALKKAKQRTKKRKNREGKNGGYAWLLARHPQIANPGKGVVSTCGIQGARHNPFHLSVLFCFFFFFFLLLLPFGATTKILSLLQWKWVEKRQHLQEKGRGRERSRNVASVETDIYRGQARGNFFSLFLKHKCKCPVPLFLKETSFNKNDESHRIQYWMRIDSHWSQPATMTNPLSLYALKTNAKYSTQV